jgi:hypothetical protein
MCLVPEVGMCDNGKKIDFAWVFRGLACFVLYQHVFLIKFHLPTEREREREREREVDHKPITRTEPVG